MTPPQKLKPLAERIRKELYYFKEQVNLVRRKAERMLMSPAFSRQTHFVLLHQLRVWIQLNIPRIEDGGNFGVSIQEDTLAEVVRCENDAIASLEQVG